MPQALAAKTYPALVDVYSQGVIQDPIDGSVTRGWNYDDPATYRCNFMSLKGHAEQFGERYASTDSVKIEMRPEDGSKVDLAMRFGNVRNAADQSETYLTYAGEGAGTIRYVFNVDAVKPQVDLRGRVVCVEVYGLLTKVS